MFTVKQLAQIAGITPRTLHYYDEIGLLEPSQVGDNGYRYYGEAALYRLQQIMLYRELDLPLEQIKRILDHPGFDAITALENHRHELSRRIDRFENLLYTVEQTILHLQGKKHMSENQLFQPFTDEQQAEMEKEAMQIYDPEIVKASSRRWKKYSVAEKQRIFDEGNVIYLDFVKAMPKGAASPEAQNCVARWRKHMDYFWTPNEEQLLSLADGYNDDPRFKANFDKIHPNLAAFVREAVKVYLKKR